MLLHYYEKGQNNDETVLFIHGSASDATVWLQEINIISAKGYHCLALDLRGHGETKEKSQPLEHVKIDIDSHLYDVTQTLMHLGILEQTRGSKNQIIFKAKKEITIVTHSFGGIIAVDLANRIPGLVKKLVLVCMPPKLMGPVKHFLKLLLGKPLEVIQQNLDWFSKTPIRSRYKSSVTTNAHVLKEIFKHVKNWNAFDSMPELTCPVYLAAGRFDFVATAKDIEKLHKRLKHSKYKLFKWSSHALMEDEPEKFQNWLIDAISRHN